MAKKAKPLGKFPSREPIQVREGEWFYEEPGGINYVVEITVNGVYHHTRQIRVPWSKVARSSLRWLAAKRKRK